MNTEYVIVIIIITVNFNNLYNYYLFYIYSTDSQRKFTFEIKRFLNLLKRFSLIYVQNNILNNRFSKRFANRSFVPRDLWQCIFNHYLCWFTFRKILKLSLIICVLRTNKKLVTRYGGMVRLKKIEYTRIMFILDDPF